VYGISLLLAGTIELLAIPVTSRSIVSGVCKYGFRSCCQIPGNGIEVCEGRLACIFQQFTALVRYCSNVNFVRFLFTAVPTYLLQPHYTNQSENVHCVTVSTERLWELTLSCTKTQERW